MKDEQKAEEDVKKEQPTGEAKEKVATSGEVADGKKEEKVEVKKAVPGRRPAGGGMGAQKAGHRPREGSDRRDRRRPQKDTSQWVPRTKLGKMVQEGKITSMADALGTRLPLREAEIVDILLPDLEDEVLDVNMVQRMTDSGRRVRFAVTVVVGNRDGYVGLGRTKGKEVGPTIHKAIDRAKLNIIAVKRGCGSWECGCMSPHTVPFKVKGKSGSTEVTFKPCPRGVGLATGDVAKKVLSLAGISDIWSLTRGQTRTTVNFSQAAFAALQQTATVKVTTEQSDRLKISSGGV